MLFTVADTIGEILIQTPDGVIELDGQTAYDIGHNSGNIASIIFSDTVLDEAAIRSRAGSDQTTSGDDNIVGTRFEDVLGGGE
nr:hypothetical protein [Roseovarius sp. W115]